MNSNTVAKNRNSMLLSLLCLLAVTAIVILPGYFKSQAGAKSSADKHVDADNLYPNYDIRSDKSAYETKAGFRQSQNKDAALVANIRDGFVAGEEALKQSVPTLKIVYNDDIRIPEVIAPDVLQGKAFLTDRISAKRADTLKGFLRENNALIGAATNQIDDMLVFADYLNPAGNMAFVELNQEINGIPVFRGEIKAGFTPSGKMFRVINNFAPGLDYSTLSKDFGDPAKAVKAAGKYVAYDFDANNQKLDIAASTDIKTVFGTDVTAEKMYFPTEPGVAVPAWRVLIYGPKSTYYVIVDVATGTMLWRKNIVEDQTQPASYSVYRNANAMVDLADNPFPMTPGPADRSGLQGAAIPRTLITKIGNEAPNTFNNLGWMTDGTNLTDGNNVQVGLDRELPATANGNAAHTDPNGVAVGNERVFDFTFQPGIPTNPAQNTGDSPTPSGQTTACLAQGTNSAPTDFQKGIMTQLFYTMNVYHDFLYTLGFTEQARNFQNDNFGRGGVGGDRVAAQAQDCAGTNNANFGTPADGGRGVMQMYLFTAPTPDVDGSLDTDVVIHEATHGVSNRLHGNGSGLALDFARGMGEGWGDFFGHSMLSEPTDPINGVYTTGSYDTYRYITAGFNNYYYGIRRFPKAVMSFTGGPNNRPHNPLTFADIDSTQQNTSDGAFPAAFSATADQVHAIGEVWSSALWEVRAKFINRLGWSVGNRRVLQTVTDGMKLAPLGPTFITERDAIIAGALATGTDADVVDLWSGFAIRGVGASASVQVVGGTSNGGLGTIRVTQAFDLPNLTQTPVITVSDAVGDNDGSFEPGEPITLTIPLSNITGNAVTGVSLSVVGGGTASYGTINSGTTVSRQVSFTVPSGTPCGSSLNIVLNVTSNLAPVTFTWPIIVGTPVVGFTENFDGVTAPAFPAGWTAAAEAGGINFVSTTTAPDTAANSAFAADPTTVGGGTSLTSPSIAINSSVATVSFKNKFLTEGGWDGGVLEISIGGGAFQDIIAAGGSFVAGGYNGVLGTGTNNPLASRNAWSGNSGGYITSTAVLPSTANGQSVQLRWRFGGDDNTAELGWNVDTISVVTSYSCSYTPPTGDSHARADFDGDGKTDLSVFRPSNGNWYINGSTSGFGVTAFGQNGDQLAPGDFDGDGKTDLSIYRPAGAPGATYFLIRSTDNTFQTASFGQTGDVNVAADYDGDGKTDKAVFRPSNNTWYILGSGGTYTSVVWGEAGDVAAPGDYDGDGKADQAIYRTGQWYIRQSTGDFNVVNWGQAGDAPVPADYDGDGKDDRAVFRPSTGVWYVYRSSDNALQSAGWGQSGDVPVPGDYDGDGKSDLAVYRNGDWYIFGSSAGMYIVNFGVATDRPVPADYIP